MAEEVLNLAGKSAEASKNTASLMEGALSSISEGTETAGESAESLLSAVEEMKKALKMVDHISDT